MSSYTIGVDGTKVGVLEQINGVSLGGLLEGEHSGGLEAKIGFEILGDLTELEWKLVGQQLACKGDLH